MAWLRSSTCVWCVDDARVARERARHIPTCLSSDLDIQGDASPLVGTVGFETFDVGSDPGCAVSKSEPVRGKDRKVTLQLR